MPATTNWRCRPLLASKKGRFLLSAVRAYRLSWEAPPPVSAGRTIAKHWADGLGFAPIPAGAPGGNVPIMGLCYGAS